MTACSDLYKKVKRCGNFCGLGDSEFRTVTKYLDFVEEFTQKYDFTEDFVYVNCPRSAVKPILKFKRGSDIRAKAMEEIKNTLNDKRSISKKFVELIMGISPSSQKIVVPITPKADISTAAISRNTVADKVRLIKAALTSGQISILTTIMEDYELDNEYEALSKALVWAKEKRK